MKIIVKIVTLGLSFSTLGPVVRAATSRTVLSCHDLDTAHRQLRELTILKEDDGRYFYRATRCNTIYVRYCLFNETEQYATSDYETAGYVEASDSGDHAPNLFGDGNISIYPAGDVGYVVNDAKSKVQLFFRKEKCSVTPLF